MLEQVQSIDFRAGKASRIRTAAEDVLGEAWRSWMPAFSEGEIMRLQLRILPGVFAVCRLTADAELPEWAMAGEFRSISWTHDELSIVCEESLVPPDVRAERGWRAFMIEGPLDFQLTGILLKVAQPLAEAGISIFAVSTFDTDYVLVKEEQFAQSREALARNGFGISELDISAVSSSRGFLAHHRR